MEFGDSCGNAGQYFGIYKFVIDGGGSWGGEDPILGGNLQINSPADLE
ncbi:MAG TPA: hypothetical protein VJ723_05895 [Candidatus Angelobacter sp.]|nr:hypothetical protein [Candidatus Angelobacter sp.]